jgi:CRP-like cAMP-binding protein
MVSTETLRRFPLFAHQSDYMLKEIAMISEEVDLEADQWLFHEKAPATKLCVVLEGGIALTMYLYLNGRGQNVSMTSPLGKGELLGWSALVKPHIYTLGAQAVKKSRVICIDAAPLSALLDDNPEYGYYMLHQIAEVMADRLVYKYIQLLSIVNSQAQPVEESV